MTRLDSFRDAFRRRRATVATQLTTLALPLGAAVVTTSVFSPTEP